MTCFACGSSDVAPADYGDPVARCVDCGQGHGVYFSPRHPAAPMTVYLSSPNNQMQAGCLAGMPVLFSFATWTPFLANYEASFSRVLIDSGAFSESNTGKKIDGIAYREWASRWIGRADAVAGLDDISGDWRRSMKNYEAFGGFPTIHDSDPPELLDDLIPLARERGGWIGLGLVPPRSGKERFVRSVCDRIPGDLHLHGWACREYAYVRRLDSADSTNWLKRSWQYKVAMPFLTPTECLQLVVKQYQRWRREAKDDEPEPSLFGEDAP